MNRKYNIDEVKDFIKSNSECTLLSKEYINNVSKLEMKCKCGEFFLVSFAKFKNGNKRMCNKCSKIKAKKKLALNYIDVFNFVKDNSDCQLLSTQYNNNVEKLLFRCGCGECFFMSFSKFKDSNRRQCYNCGVAIRISKSKHPHQYVSDFIKDKSEGSVLISQYNRAKDNIVIKCKCGEVYTTTFDIFIRGNYRCYICTKSMSNLEFEVKKILDNRGISYIYQYRDHECKNVYTLPFDFAVFDNLKRLKFLVEVDGVQHFKPVDFFGGDKSFYELKKRDKIKDEYCKKNNILLIRLPFDKKDEFENILKNYL